ncbi:MAG: NADH-ubiquinone oxidoreductase-F iron-sulfur binding region domain-containing protein [Acidimicrobiales bacterium]
MRGRGGAGFPAARKMAPVGQRRGHAVVVNATEGEPASSKDRLLITAVPHLVLDDAQLAAMATGAERVVVCVDWTDRFAVATLGAAIEERRNAGERPITLVRTPPRYGAGEETALVSFINGGSAKPAPGSVRPFERGVDGRPTLVHNAETLAHVSLIGRYGAAWFRSCGTEQEPGTMLLTVTAGRRSERTVLEAEIGVPGVEIMAAGGIDATVRAVMVGGYFGTWVRAEDFARAPYSTEGLAPLGSSPGAGVVVALPAAACGIAETARILAWYAAESAGQCGPCVFGLPALASATAELARGTASTGTVVDLRRWSGDIDRRGACRHPDGAVRLLRSALEVFADDLERHAAGRPCSRTAESVVAAPRSHELWR